MVGLLKRTLSNWVLHPFLRGLGRRIYAALLSFGVVVIPPLPTLGRSLFQSQSHSVAICCTSSMVAKIWRPAIHAEPSSCSARRMRSVLLRLSRLDVGQGDTLVFGPFYEGAIDVFWAVARWEKAHFPNDATSPTSRTEPENSSFGRSRIGRHSTLGQTLIDAGGKISWQVTSSNCILLAEEPRLRIQS